MTLYTAGISYITPQVYLLANHLTQLVDILEQHVVVRHGHIGKRGCSPQDSPPTRILEDAIVGFYCPKQHDPGNVKHQMLATGTQSDHSSVRVSRLATFAWLSLRGPTFSSAPGRLASQRAS